MSNVYLRSGAAQPKDVILRPLGINPEVTDSLGLSDSTLVNKTLIITDSTGLNDMSYTNKMLILMDSLGLSDITEKFIKAFTYLHYIRLRYIKGYSIVKRAENMIGKLNPITLFKTSSPIHMSGISPNISGSKRLQRIKPKYTLDVYRNGARVYHKKRTRDLLIWRGQSIFAYLLSQGEVGTSTSGWQAVASENSDASDMGDDSGDPLNNEFDPVIGTPVDISWSFNPTTKPSGGYQTYADLTMSATVISDGSKTLRKIGIIDKVSTPNKHIIIEDNVPDFSVVLNDNINIVYTIQLG